MKIKVEQCSFAFEFPFLGKTRNTLWISWQIIPLRQESKEAHFLKNSFKRLEKQVGFPRVKPFPRLCKGHLDVEVSSCNPVCWQVHRGVWDAHQSSLSSREAGWPLALSGKKTKIILWDLRLCWTTHYLVWLKWGTLTKNNVFSVPYSRLSAWSLDMPTGPCISILRTLECFQHPLSSLKNSLAKGFWNWRLVFLFSYHMRFLKLIYLGQKCKLGRRKVL